MISVTSDLLSNDDLVIDLPNLKERISSWTNKLKEGANLVAKPSVRSEPFKNIYAGIESISVVNFEVDAISNVPSVKVNPVLKFWIRLAKIHVLSSLAKWYELSEELSVAETHHVQCIELIEKELEEEEMSLPESMTQMTISPSTEPDSEENANSLNNEEMMRAKDRVKYMYIYELTRYAILCSERDNQTKALEFLKKAEAYYHENCTAENLQPPLDPSSLLGMLDSLNSETSKDMFTYVLFYLGQAYKIKGEKERAILYLHMVLRRQLEKGDYNNITWGSDCSRMASVLMSNEQTFETARDILVAATTIMKHSPEEEKGSDHFRQNFAELGRCWGKFGTVLLEISGNRLKDLQDEDSNRKQLKFESRITLDRFEKQSLELAGDQMEYDTILLIRALRFPTLDVSEVNKVEMKGRFVRDFDEARAVFLPAQKWINIAKEYYNLDEYASDHIDIISDYASLYKHLSFYEPCLSRQITMHKRRITLLEDLLSALNPKVYTDIFHGLLRELAETYEVVYKRKVDEYKDRGKSLRPKDMQLVSMLVSAVNAHKRNLVMFGFDIDHPEKSFAQDYEKVLMAFVLSIGRILGNICHDHPLHSDAVILGEESKRFYQFFLDYLDRHIELKREFITLYDGSRDMPELLDSQIRKIRHHLRMRSAAQSENA